MAFQMVCVLRLAPKAQVDALVASSRFLPPCDLDVGMIQFASPRKQTRESSFDLRPKIRTTTPYGAILIAPHLFLAIPFYKAGAVLLVSLADEIGRFLPLARKGQHVIGNCPTFPIVFVHVLPRKSVQNRKCCYRRLRRGAQTIEVPSTNPTNQTAELGLQRNQAILPRLGLERPSIRPDPATRSCLLDEACGGCRSEFAGRLHGPAKHGRR